MPFCGKRDTATNAMQIATKNMPPPDVEKENITGEMIFYQPNETASRHSYFENVSQNNSNSLSRQQQSCKPGH